MSNPVIPGSCLCGAVKFEVTPPSRFVAHCHCTLCRRAHGAPFVTWVGVKNDQFRITAGATDLSHYQSTPEAKRTFCKHCGSPLFFSSTRWPGEIHVAAPHLLGPLDQKPKAHVFFDDHAAWITVNDDLPRFGGKTGVEPLKD